MDHENPNSPISSDVGADQIETDYQASHDRPGSGAREDVENSKVMTNHAPEPPGLPLATPETIPHSRPNHLTVPSVEGDDRIDHQWRAGDDGDHAEEKAPTV